MNWCCGPYTRTEAGPCLGLLRSAGTQMAWKVSIRFTALIWLSRGVGLGFGRRNNGMSVKWALASSAGGATQHASDCTLNPRPGAGPYSLLLGLCLCRFPYNPLYTKKGTLLIPRLLLGLGILPDEQIPPLAWSQIMTPLPARARASMFLEAGPGISGLGWGSRPSPRRRLYLPAA